MQENVYDITSNCIQGYNVSVFESKQSDVSNVSVLLSSRLQRSAALNTRSLATLVVCEASGQKLLHSWLKAAVPESVDIHCLRNSECGSMSNTACSGQMAQRT